MNTVITGGNRGIGLELVKICQERGDQVYVLCRKGNDELNRLGVIVIEDVELTDPLSYQMVQKKLSNIHIDLLINNAGVFKNETLESMDFETINKQFQINTLAPLHLVDALLPLVNKGGKIAFITSRMGSIEDNTSGSYYGYRMSKAALNAAGKSLAIDLKSSDISVILLHPGYVQTKMTNFQGDILPNEAATGLIKQINELSLKTTGIFKHSNEEELPW